MKKKTSKKKAPKKAPPKPKAPPKAKRHPATADLPDDYVWDEERDGPARTTWLKRPPAPPCPKCKATATKGALQALRCYGIGLVDGEEVAYVHCHVCFKKSQMPVGS